MYGTTNNTQNAERGCRMGFFSWRTSDTDRSISNRYSCRGTFTVYLLIPKEFGGGYLKEDDYEGYGMFGGADAYSMLAKWNLGTTDRIDGIDLKYKHPEDMKYPLKFTEYPCDYEDVDESESCEWQGYFYPEDDDEDDY